jgi:hypothetical protein
VGDVAVADRAVIARAGAHRIQRLALLIYCNKQDLG